MVDFYFRGYKDQFEAFYHLFFIYQNTYFMAEVHKSHFHIGEVCHNITQARDAARNGVLFNSGQIISFLEDFY